MIYCDLAWLVLSDSENGAERAENYVERSAAWSWRGDKRWSGSAARSGRLWSWNGAV